MSRILRAVWLIVWLVPLCVVPAEEPKIPPGFRAIFNGRDLTGWYGFNPHSVANLDSDERQAALKKMRNELAQHWRVEDGELVNDGKEPYATTELEYGNIELQIEYKIVPKVKKYAIRFDDAFLTISCGHVVPAADRRCGLSSRHVD